LGAFLLHPVEVRDNRRFAMATNPQTPIDETLRPVLEHVRKDLLDFGMRNPLLNYRLLKSKGLESVPLDPVPLFEALVTEGRDLSFSTAQIATQEEKQLLLQDNVAPPESSEESSREVPDSQQTC
jgi:hypothetical protein